MYKELDLNKVYQYLLILLAFLLPITVSGANTVIVIICMLWLLSGNYKSKFQEIFSSKLLLASVIFYIIHVISLIWTEDYLWGFHILHKMWYFLLLFPILYSIVEKKFISKYIFAFLLAILITEIFSYLVWFEILERFMKARPHNPTPFMSHVSHNPILAFAIYIVSHKVLFDKKITFKMRLGFILFVTAMTFNMFITGGRAGQVMFFAMLAILIFQFFNSQKIKSLFAIFILLPVLFYSAYASSSYFQQRVDSAVDDVINYQSDKNTSVGLRITFALNSWEIIKQNPFLGAGVGDFPKEYKKINTINTPNLTNTTNPHNMYILICSQLGILGLVSFISIFYHQIKISLIAKDRFIKDVGVTLPLLFLLIMLSDSYLLGHFTSLMFVFFSSFLYKDFEKS